MNYSKKEQPCEGKVLEEEEKNDIESENVDVVAPATLVAGFEFEAVYQGETFIVKVVRINVYISMVLIIT